jgi:hypothetical protein
MLLDRDPKFAVVYLAEMQAVMAEMGAGNPALRVRALEVESLESSFAFSGMLT